MSTDCEVEDADSLLDTKVFFPIVVFMILNVLLIQDK